MEIILVSEIQERDAMKPAWSKVADENSLVLCTTFRNVTFRIKPEEKSMT